VPDHERLSWKLKGKSNTILFLFTGKTLAYLKKNNIKVE
jgi:hypothetical protein